MDVGVAEAAVGVAVDAAAVAVASVATMPDHPTTLLVRCAGLV